MSFINKLVFFFATGCYLGKIPVAPGTFGTFLGIFFCFLLSRINNFLFTSVFTVFFILISIWIAHIGEKIEGTKDPNCIVIDEIAGIIVALTGLPFNTFNCLIGFFVFRAFDIIKPFPIRLLENKLSGGTGIVLDDVAAGIYANLVLRLISLFFIALSS